MTDNQTQPDPENELLDDGDFNDFESGGGNSLAELWRNNPMVKLGIIGGALLLVIGGVVLFGGKPEQTPTSVMKGGASVKETPGTEEVSEAYATALEEKNRADLQEAQKTGGSAIPVPITPPKAQVTLPEVQATQEDPLERWRRMQEDRQKQEAAKKPEAPQGDPNADAINNLANAMSKQMESVLTSVAPKPPQYVVMPQLTEKTGGEGTGAQNGRSGAGGNEENKNAEQVVDILVPAGTIEYGQLVTEANSDAPGPVLAQIVSGPMAGSKLLGTFEVQEDRYLVLHFNTIVVDGISRQTDAVAIDPSTANPGMVTDVDKRYFQRVILPAAAAFVEGMGSALAETGSTSVATTGGAVSESKPEPDTEQELFKGVEEASSKIGQLLDEEASKIKPMVKVAAGTPMGVLFIQPVTQDVDEGPQIGQ